MRNRRLTALIIASLFVSSAFLCSIPGLTTPIVNEYGDQLETTREGEIEFGDNVEGEIEDIDVDSHVWRFEGEAGQQVLIFVDGLIGLDPVVALYTSELELIEMNNNFSGLDSRLLEILPEDDTYIIRITGNRAGTYELSLQDVDVLNAEATASAIPPTPTPGPSPTPTLSREEEFQTALDEMIEDALADSAPEGFSLERSFGSNELIFTTELTVGNAIGQEIEDADDGFGYVFAGLAEQAVDMRFFTQANLTLTATLYDSSGTVLLESEGINGLDVRFNQILPADDTYTIEVSGNRRGNYFIVIENPEEPVDFPRTDYYDEYLTIGTEPITFDTPVTGSLSNSVEASNWVFGGTAGQKILITAEAGETSDIGLALHDPSNFPYAINAFEPRLVVFLPEDGLYTIRVNTFLNQPTDFTVTVLDISDSDFNDTYPTEDTQSISFAQLLQGTIDEAGTADNWEFEGVAETTVSVLVAGDGRFLPDFDLYAPGGVLIGEAQATQFVPGTITATLPVDGTYVIRVSDEEDVGEYTVSLEEAPETEQDELFSTGEVAIDTLSFTEPIVIGGQPINTIINADLEEHSWIFQGAANLEITITIEGQGGFLPVSVNLRDPAGAQIATTDDFVDNALTITLPIEGAYFLSIVAVPPGNYTLSVQ